MEAPSALHVALDRLPGAVVVVDDAGRTVYENPLAAGLRLAPLAEDGRLEVPYNGIVRFFEQRSALLGDGHTLILFTEVTERELRLIAEREFLTMAAHDLQSPIAAIIGVSEALTAGAGEDPALRARFLAHLQRETRRLDRLAVALMALAHARRSGERVPIEVVALRPLLEEAADVLIPARGVTIEVDCPDDLAALTHAALLEQAVFNLAANAARHTREGSIRLSATGEASRARIEIADTGAGIAFGDRHRIFRRYEQGRVGARGTAGLGLSISHEIVEALGGRVELVETSDRGSTFAIELPGATITR